VIEQATQAFFTCCRRVGRWLSRPVWRADPCAWILDHTFLDLGVRASATFFRKVRVANADHGFVGTTGLLTTGIITTGIFAAGISATGILLAMAFLSVAWSGSWSGSCSESGRELLVSRSMVDSSIVESWLVETSVIESSTGGFRRAREVPERRSGQSVWPGRQALTAHRFSFACPDADEISEMERQEPEESEESEEPEESEEFIDEIPPLSFLAKPPRVALEAELAAPLSEPLKAGHLTFYWMPAAEASGYRLVSGDGTIHYEGRLPRAFVSGLPDGDYRFRVIALDREASPLDAQSDWFSVSVRHWDLTFAWSVFAIGAVVFVSVLVVLGWGIGLSRQSAGGEATGGDQ